MQKHKRNPRLKLNYQALVHIQYVLVTVYNNTTVRWNRAQNSSNNLPLIRGSSTRWSDEQNGGVIWTCKNGIIKQLCKPFAHSSTVKYDLAVTNCTKRGEEMFELKFSRLYSPHKQLLPLLNYPPNSRRLHDLPSYVAHKTSTATAIRRLCVDT